MKIPFKEFTPDLPDPLGGLRVAKNVFPFGLYYGSVPDFATASAVLPSKPLNAFAVTDPDGNNSVFVGTATKLYKLNSDGNFDDVTRLSGDYNTLGDETWNFEQFGTNITATNYSDDVQVFNLASDTKFSDLAGNPPKSRRVAVIGDFIALADTEDSDGQQITRIRWCGINNITQWTPSVTTQSDYQNIENGGGGHIQGVVGFGTYGIIIQERAITRMTYVGSPLVFRFDLVEQKRGAKIASSIISNGKSIFFIDSNGFYEFINNQAIPIGLDKVDNYFWDNVNPSYLNKVTVSTNPTNKLILWSYPTRNSLNGEPDEILVYNWERKQWSTISKSLLFLFRSITLGYTLEGLDSVSTNIDTLPFSLDSRVWQGGTVLLAGFSADYKLGYFNSDTKMEAILETNETQLVEQQKSEISRVEPLVEGGNGSIKIGYRDQLSNTVNYSVSTSENTYGYCNIRVPNAFYHRVRLTLSSGFTKAYGVDIKLKSAGER